MQKKKEQGMGFTNEFTSHDDYEKYRLGEVDARFQGGNASRQWTIDRERNIYLRMLSRGRELETRHQGIWSFNWKGADLTLWLELIGGEGKPGLPGSSHWRLVNATGEYGALPSFGRDRAVLRDLKEALLTYKDGGMFAVNTEYSVTLDVAPGCRLS